MPLVPQTKSNKGRNIHAEIEDRAQMYDKTKQQEEDSVCSDASAATTTTKFFTFEPKKTQFFEELDAVQLTLQKTKMETRRRDLVKGLENQNIT